MKYPSNYELYMENIPGLVVIDMNAKLDYANRQTSGYFTVSLEEAIGRHVLEIFPPSHMPENLYIDEPKIVYYSSKNGIGISTEVPLFRDGTRIGLLEYDLLDTMDLRYDFPLSYSSFLDRELQRSRSLINAATTTRYTITDIIGRSAAMNELRNQIIVAAKSSSPVLIFGETGTGKELVAQSIHDLSARRKEPMIALNAAALPDDLIESELFGYRGGVFTGASKEGKKGRFKLADKGTLFLDEINKMPLTLQSKLLRVLEEQKVDPIGADASIPIDVRIIAATNADLMQLITQGQFQSDLYYRINVLSIRVPPLRERKEDIRDLTDAHIKFLNERLHKNITHVDEQVYRELEKRDWPGNVRELFNVIEKAMHFTSGSTIRMKDLSFDQSLPAVHPDDALLFNNQETKPLDIVRNQAEKDLILRVLRLCEGNKTEAAKYLKINRTLLYQKMKRLRIT